MSFPRSVREQALLKSHRRCCVCHEFAGRNSNVHHLIPEAEGGPNGLDNAIVLCFNCHAEAGHYNPKHPLGTKYSPEELVAHRDQWWEQCEKHPGEIATGSTVTVPEFSAVFLPVASQSKSGRKADELLCVWTGQLRLTNISPHDAFKVKLHVEGDDELEIQQSPPVVRSGELKELRLQCSRYFDRRQIHPSRYAPPSQQPPPTDIDPLMERCPDVLTNLTLAVVFDNSSGQSFVQDFRRESGEQELKPEKPKLKPDNGTNELEMPPQADDPAFRDGARQLFVQTYGRAPTKKEIDQMLAETIITFGRDQITEQDLAEVEEMEKRRTKD